MAVQALNVLVLQGPNLDRLGRREVERYGRVGLADIHAQLEEVAASVGAKLRVVVSAREGELIEAIHAASDDGFAGAVVNAGAFTHTSVGIRDALLSRPLPFVEVHLTNIFAREPFRRASLLADVAIGGVSGLGAAGYEAALRGLVAHRRAG